MMSAFERMKDLTVKLCEIKDNDSVEADNIRDEMDFLWYDLTKKEQDKIKQIAIDYQNLESKK